MMDNYREHKEVIFYADKLHVSSKYLSEVVKETSGKSPKDWIIDYSLLEIKELLKNSSLNIQEITIRTKFLNQSALGRFLKDTPICLLLNIGNRLISFINTLHKKMYF